MLKFDVNKGGSFRVIGKNEVRIGTFILHGRHLKFHPEHVAFTPDLLLCIATELEKLNKRILT